MVDYHKIFYISFIFFLERLTPYTAARFHQSFLCEVKKLTLENKINIFQEIYMDMFILTKATVMFYTAFTETVSNNVHSSVMNSTNSYWYRITLEGFN